MLSSCLGLGKECVCVCGEHVCVGWGENGSCQRVARATGKLPPSFPGQTAAPSDSGGDWGRKPLTQRNATLLSAGRPTITQHIFYSLLNCAGGRMGVGGGQTSKIIPQRVFWFPLFCNSNSLCLGQQLDFLAGTFSVFAVAVHSRLVPRREKLFGDRWRQMCPQPLHMQRQSVSFQPERWQGRIFSYTLVWVRFQCLIKIY